MSAVLDKIVSELQEFADAPAAEGGLRGILDIQSIQKGDPGWVISEDYPYLMVEVEPIAPKSETMGKAGYDIIIHNYAISIMLDATEFFDPAVAGNDAEGPLEDAAIALLLWFRRLGNRNLDFETKIVRNVTVGSVDFIADGRDSVYAKRALLLLGVERQHQHQP